MKEDIVSRWIGKADNDLRAVKYLLAIKDAPLDIVSFHCQQAVEKYLRAYLTWVDVRVTKTHDLSNILNVCVEKDKEFEKLDRIRYPA